MITFFPPSGGSSSSSEGLTLQSRDILMFDDFSGSILTWEPPSSTPGSFSKSELAFVGDSSLQLSVPSNETCMVTRMVAAQYSLADERIIRCFLRFCAIQEGFASLRVTLARNSSSGRYYGQFQVLPSDLQYKDSSGNWQSIAVPAVLLTTTAYYWNELEFTLDAKNQLYVSVRLNEGRYDFSSTSLYDNSGATDPAGHWRLDIELTADASNAANSYVDSVVLEYQQQS